MSVKYEMLKSIVKKTGIKNSWNLSAEEIIEIKKKQNSRVKIPKLKDSEIDISRIYIQGCPVIAMKHREKTDHANMFIIGGGMVSAPRPGSIRKALRFAKETGLDLYIPYYPLCTVHPLTKAYSMIYDTYCEMLKDYDAENISLLGTSSGGNLALGLAAYINEQGNEVPMPAHIMTISPGTCAATDEEWQRMLELDSKDPVIPASYMKTAVDIMKHGDDSVPDYMIYLQKADFTGCPKVTFIYGSDETLYAVAPSFEAAMKKYNVDYDMIVGEGMFHCYPVFPGICREAEDGWKQMVDIMKADKDHPGSRKSEIKSAYRSLGKAHSFYDGMMTGSTALGMAVVKMVWQMDREDMLEYQAGAFEPIPAGFAGRLLEVPVGTGVLSMPVWKTLPDADITCLDYSEKMMEAASDRAKEMGIDNISFVQGDVGALPFEEGSFDAVVSLNGFHAFPDKEAAYSETYRVLKPGGTFSGCFYVQDSNKHTDRMINRFYIRSGFFTPPFETAESLRHRLEGMYDDVEVYTVKSIAVFKARKRKNHEEI
jgi:ubiquinone/menaquinone biosynthesis C-methylase UbiE/acetyl esterase/lipase